MMSAKTRLIVAAGLFIAWIGWLTYLVVRTRNPVILSHPQFLVADVIVVAQLTGDDKPDRQIKVIEVLWSNDKSKPAKDDELDVIFLEDCTSKYHGWEGRGEYLVPLKKKGDVYTLQEIPPSPGYPPGEAALKEKSPRLRIYRATDDARRQADDLIATRKQAQ
jgi:hypothetical protein